MAQLERADELINRKIEIAGWYDEMLLQSPYTTHVPIGDVRHSYWMYSVLVPHVRQRDDIRGYLKRAGIETRPTFYPVHTMPMYSGKYERHPIAEEIGWRGINLPSYPDLTHSQVQQVCIALMIALDQSHTLAF